MGDTNYLQYREQCIGKQFRRSPVGAGGGQARCCLLPPRAILGHLHCLHIWIIIGSDRRPETKQGIEGKIARFRSGRVRVRDRVRDRYN